VLTTYINDVIFDTDNTINMAIIGISFLLVTSQGGYRKK